MSSEKTLAKLQMALHSGAIWQLYTKLERMAQALSDHGIPLQLETR